MSLEVEKGNSAKKKRREIRKWDKRIKRIQYLILLIWQLTRHTQTFLMNKDYLIRHNIKKWTITKITFCKPKSKVYIMQVKEWVLYFSKKKKKTQDENFKGGQVHNTSVCIKNFFCNRGRSPLVFETWFRASLQEYISPCTINSFINFNISPTENSNEFAPKLHPSVK